MTISEAYKILEINENSSEEEIKLAYKKLAKKYHPDFYQNNPLADLAEEKLKEVNEAYDVLTKNKASKRQADKKEYKYEDSNTKVQKVVLYWQGYSWELKNGIIEYNIFRKEIESMMATNLIMYESRYKVYNSFDEFISRDKRLFMGDIERIFSTLVDTCIKNDYDMFSAKILTKNYFNRVAEDYLYYYNECLEFINAIDTNRRNEKEWKKTKDYYRGKTSLFDKAVRGVSNMYDEMGDNQKKEEMYSNPETLRLFKEAYRSAMLECMNVILELLKINYRPNEVMSDSILENINRYSKEKRTEKLLQALTCNPYDCRVYTEMLSNFGDIDNELSKIAVYFGQNIEILKKDKIDDYIKEFNNLKGKDIYLAVKKFKEKMYLLGKNAESYINLQEEIRKAKDQKMNAYIAEFRESVLLDENLAINTLKERAKELELDLERYINLRDVINFEKNKKAGEYVAIFRTEVKQNKNKAERELKERINKLGLKLEDFVDLDKEYQNLAKYKRNKQYILIAIVLIIFGFFAHNRYNKYQDKLLIPEPIPRITNEKILNQDIAIEITSYDNEKLESISKKYPIRYSSFKKNDKQYGKEYVYFMFFEKNGCTYRISCSRKGNLALEVYISFGSGDYLLYAIPNLEKPTEILFYNIEEEAEQYVVLLDLKNLNDGEKKIIKNMKEILDIFKEFSKDDISLYTLEVNNDLKSNKIISEYGIKPIPRVTNEKILNQDKDLQLILTENKQIKKITGNKKVEYILEKKFQAPLANQLAYHIYLVEDDGTSYSLECTRTGVLKLTAYDVDYSTVSILNLENPNKLFTYDYKNYKQIPLNPNNLINRQEILLKNMKKTLDIFKRISKETDINLGI